MEKNSIAITMGDPAGIGAEIIVKSLKNKELLKENKLIVVGDKRCFKDAISFTNSSLKLNIISDVSEYIDEDNVLNLINLGFYDNQDWKYKQVDKYCGFASYKYILKAIELAKQNKVQAVVTGPINKESIHLAGVKEAGHTEIFANETNTKKYSMLLAADNLRVIHVTTHVALKDVSSLLSVDRVFECITLANKACLDLGIEHPRVAVCGLNPHAGENGLFGDEEIKFIKPAIEKAAAQGIDVTGPAMPDTVFTKAVSGLFDIVVAMYHDQGHIPLKLHGFKFDSKTGTYSSVCGVNITLGLPFPRVSVDHGVAYGKAGEGRANEESMVESIKYASRLIK